MALVSKSRASSLARPAAVQRRVVAPVRCQQAAPAATASAQDSAAPAKSYYVVMNVFKVKPEFGPDFEGVWKARESHLKEMPGFVRFAMLKCTNVPGKYISQTTWADEASFKNWAQSSQFKASHGSSSGSGSNDSKRPSMMTMLDGPPSPEFFESVTVTEW